MIGGRVNYLSTLEWPDDIIINLFSMDQMWSYYLMLLEVVAKANKM